MEFKFTDLDLAFEFVSAAAMTENLAIICKETGEIYYWSEYGDEDKIPEDVYGRDDCIEIPHKNDLNLGRNLVFEFVEQYLPDDLEQVRQIFRKRGAYARFKDLLNNRGALQKWYDFENARQSETLREWCRDNDIMLIG